ncbi:MAG: Na(+)/H(+) antiporter subunit D [Elusimicrobia bacterium]|nr:Na(+)/H(+) antiporter subunit D [Elusimicrobiota bacterium]
MILHPGLPFAFAAPAILVGGRRWQKAVLLSAPLAALLILFQVPVPSTQSGFWMGIRWIWLRADSLSWFFGLAFVLLTFFGNLYALHLDNRKQHVAALGAAGASLGAVFAGDLVTLFVFWELLSVASMFLIWNRSNPRSLGAGFRYLLVHLAGGLCLFAGCLLYGIERRAFTFETIPLDGGGFLILLGFLIHAAVPPLHAWLPDAYPESTPTGSVYLSAYVTKTAVYVLARGFFGVEALAWVGALMAVYGVVYAFLENNIRRILSYHIVSQVGYMVCGIGLGSALSVSGSSAHAFSHILYKGLLFMAAGAVIEATGRSKLTELGGLWRSMFWVGLFYFVGAFAISGGPFLNGFVSKSIVLEAAHLEKKTGIFLLLELASVGTFLSLGLKLPYFCFFHRPTSRPVRPLTQNMYWAMGGLAFLCLFTGVYPQSLYRLLPFSIRYHPYDLPRLLQALGLLAATGALFYLLLPRIKVADVALADTDRFYRRGALWILQALQGLQCGWKIGCENIQSRVAIGLGSLEGFFRRGLGFSSLTTSPIFFLVWILLLFLGLVLA